MQRIFLEYSEKLRQITAISLKTMFERNFWYQAKSEEPKTYNTCNEHTSSFGRGTDIVKSMAGWAFTFPRMDIFKKVTAGGLHVYDKSTTSDGQITMPTMKQHMKNIGIIENLQREIKSNGRVIDGLKIKVQSQRVELLEKTTKLASLEVENVTKKMQLCCLQSTNDAQASTIADFIQKIKDLEDEVAMLNGDVSEKNIEVARLISEAGNKPQDLEPKTDQELSCELATLRIEACEREQEVQDQSNRISELENTIKLKDVLINTLQVNDEA